MSTAPAGRAPGPLARFLESQGIARPIAWGFVAVTLFMVGDGLESGFLSPYLTDQHFAAPDIALLFTVYGIVVAVAAWLSGALSEAWGPKRVMLFGFAIWFVFQIAFLLSVGAHNFGLMLLFYGIRGLGYPMFSYGFLVWITRETPQTVLGRGVGWYWFFSTLGLGVISSYYAGAVLPFFGEFVTLWTSLAFIVAGGLICLFVLRNPDSEKVTLASSVSGLVRSVTIVGERPKVGIGGFVRLVNTTSFYAFVVYLTTYMVKDVGFSQESWQVIWGTMLAANVVTNVAAGYIGDWFGRVRTVAWFGGVGCFITVLALFYVPTWIGPNFGVTIFIAIVYGITLGMFVPLSAIMPLLAPHHKAAAVAILNLGAGASQFVGPALAALVTPIGAGMTTWIISLLYVVGFILTWFLRRNEREKAEAAEVDRLEAESGGTARPVAGH